MSYKQLSPIPVVEGGTGVQTISSGELVVGAGTSAVTSIPYASSPAGTDNIVARDSSGDTSVNKLTCAAFQMTTGASDGYALLSDVSGNGTWTSLATYANTYTTDSGNATPSGGVLNVLGDALNTNTAGSGDTVTVALNNSINLGSLGDLTGVAALTATTGNVDIVAGNLLFPYNNATFDKGIMFWGGSPYIWTNRADNTFIGNGAGNIATGSGTSNTALGYQSGLSLNTGSSDNVCIGINAMFSSSTTTYGIGIGSSAYYSATSGSGCVAVGHLALSGLLTGSNCLALGDNSASEYVGSESNNITIGSFGVVGDNNVIRIGQPAIHTSCYITGIDGVNVGSVARVVTEASNKLGTATLTPGANITITPGANTITIAASGVLSSISITGDTGGALSGSSFTFTGGTTGLKFDGAGTTETLSGTLVVANGGTGATTLTGVLTGNGTGAVTANAVTNHGVLIGGASNAVSSLGVATNGQLVIGSTGANPVLANLTSTGGTISITNGAGSINLEASGSTVLQKLTPDSGADVTPTAGAISITGYPQTSGLVKGMKTFNGGTSIFEISNLDAITPYVVGSDANTAAFTSIQTAINQAVSDGASVSTPAVVWITPGHYTEDLSLVPYVHLAAAVDASVGAAQITGNAVFTGAGEFSATNIGFLSANTSAALSFQGTDTATVHLQSVSCDAGSSGGIGLELANDNVTVNVTIGSLAAGTGGRCKNVSGGTLLMFSSTSQNTDTASTISGGSSVTIFSSFVGDSFALTGTSQLFLQQAEVFSGSAPCVDVGSTAAVLVSNSIMLTSDDHIITGSGNAIYANIVANSGTTIQNTINQAGPGIMVQNISFDGGASFLNTDGQIWIGSSSGVPAPANITSSGGSISITNGANSINLETGSGGGFVWTEVTGSSETMLIGNGYIASSNTLITFTMPTVSAIGDTIKLMGKGVGGWTIVYGAGQQINFSSATTTISSGSLSSTNARDSIELVCTTASNTAPIYTVASSIGNITVV